MAKKKASKQQQKNDDRSAEDAAIPSPETAEPAVSGMESVETPQQLDHTLPNATLVESDSVPTDNQNAVEFSSTAPHQQEQSARGVQQHPPPDRSVQPHLSALQHDDSTGQGGPPLERVTTAEGTTEEEAVDPLNPPPPPPQPCVVGVPLPPVTSSHSEQQQQQPPTFQAIHDEPPTPSATSSRPKTPIDVTVDGNNNAPAAAGTTISSVAVTGLDGDGMERVRGDGTTVEFATPQFHPSNNGDHEHKIRSYDACDVTLDSPKQRTTPPLPLVVGSLPEDVLKVDEEEHQQQRILDAEEHDQQHHNDDELFSEEPDRHHNGQPDNGELLEAKKSFSSSLHYGPADRVTTLHWDEENHLLRLDTDVPLSTVGGGREESGAYRAASGGPMQEQQVAPTTVTVRGLSTEDVEDLIRVQRTAIEESFSERLSSLESNFATALASIDAQIEKSNGDQQCALLERFHQLTTETGLVSEKLSHTTANFEDFKAQQCTVQLDTKREITQVSEMFSEELKRLERHMVDRLENVEQTLTSRISLAVRALIDEMNRLNERVAKALRQEDLPPPRPIPEGPKIRLTVAIFSSATNTTALSTSSILRRDMLVPISAKSNISDLKHEILRRAKQQKLVSDDCIYSTSLLGLPTPFGTKQLEDGGSSSSSLSSTAPSRHTPTGGGGTTASVSTHWKDVVSWITVLYDEDSLEDIGITTTDKLILVDTSTPSSSVLNVSPPEDEKNVAIEGTGAGTATSVKGAGGLPVSGASIVDPTRTTSGMDKHSTRGGGASPKGASMDLLVQELSAPIPPPPPPPPITAKIGTKTRVEASSADISLLFLDGETAARMHEEESLERRLQCEYEKMEREPIAHAEILERIQRYKSKANSLRVALIDRATYSHSEQARQSARSALDKLNSAIHVPLLSEAEITRVSSTASSAMRQSFLGELISAMKVAQAALSLVEATSGEKTRIEMMERAFENDLSRKERCVEEMKTLISDLQNRVRIPRDMLLAAQKQIDDAETAVILAPSSSRGEVEATYERLRDFVNGLRGSSSKAS